jgi:molybdate transport system permease protein
VIVAYHPYTLPVYTFVQFDSTGVGSTMLPIAAALGAALIVLALTMMRARPSRSRRRQTPIPASAAPPAASATPLRFALQAHIDGFGLALSHDGSGRRLALLGPSGAGKTLTLRLLAGIAEADRAEIFAGERPLHEVAAERRDVGYLPQQSALLPGRTVWQQVTFGVDADPAVGAWWLEQLGLTGLECRLPSELSGGQQRRVALARALARKPGLLCRKLRAIQRQAGLATVLVTHDPEEAALLADKLIVIDRGRALQQGPIGEVFARPASPQVAALLGIPNTYAGVVAGPGKVRAGALELATTTDGLPPGADVTWAVRPEDIAVVAGGRYRATLLDAVVLAGGCELRFEVEGVQLIARQRGTLSIDEKLAGPLSAEIGASVMIDLPPEAITVWPSDEEASGESAD